MNLPNYFLADLPPEAPLSPALLTEACAALKYNRRNYLAQRTTRQIIATIAEVAAGWRRPDHPFRRLALEHGPQELGFSRATLAHGLDEFFAALTGEALEALVVQDLGEVRRLDDLGASPVEAQSGRAGMAMGPEFLIHIAAGNLPNPTLMSMVLGLLTRAAQWVKCARGTTLVPRLFAHSIYEHDPKLAACMEIAAWPGGTANLDAVLFAEADCVTATGQDETLLAIRNQLPARTRFLGYGHRVSFGFVAGAVLTAHHARKVVARAADDVVAWDQLGCLSPQVFYVASGGDVAPDRFAELLGEELARRELIAPRGLVSSEVAATIAARRAIYALRAAHSPATRIWQSADSTAWTVVCAADEPFPISCLHRFIHVRPVADLAEVLQQADAVRGHVSTVGLAVPEFEAAKIAIELGRWGAKRICPLGQMQRPPLAWRHDGRPALGDLITWTDFES